MRGLTVSRRTVFGMAVVTAAVGVAGSTAGIATAQTAQQPADLPGVDLDPGKGVIKANDDWWYVHGGTFEFAVTLGARTQGRKRTVRLAVPKGLNIVSINGDKWKVEKVDDTDVEATHPELENPGLKLPKLVIAARSKNFGASTLDASVREKSVNYKRRGVKLMVDTST
ncbi:MAG: hypothetical protein ABWY11_08245 [Umezawaea sp.]